MPAPAEQAAAMGPLPEWNLADLYPAPDSQALKSDLDRAEAAAKAFRERWKGKLAAASGDTLAGAIKEYEALEEGLGKAMSYAQLAYAGNMSDAKIASFYQSVQERVTTISSETLFFRLEINAIDDAVLDAKLRSPAAYSAEAAASTLGSGSTAAAEDGSAAKAGLAHYRPWLRDVRVYRPHQLAEDMERLLHEKYVAGRAAWHRLFDETIAALRFPLDGKQLTSAEALHLLSDPERDVRKGAAKSIGQVFGDNVRLFAHITNTLAKEKEIEDRWRHYAKPQSERNLSNQVEDEVVDALTTAVKAAYPKIAHRYYALKARWLGLEQLEYWDRNAPLPDDSDVTIPWPEAEKIVLDSLTRFSPELAAIGRRFFEKRWIDAPVRPGKAPGAFAHPTVPSAHPYLLLNYQGKTRDVMTLAHELGHGVHQVLAAPQGQLMADTPLTLAETASVFGEMLTFRTLLARETDPKRRKAMIAGKVEDMINTVIRQIAFYDFELRVHIERRNGELSADRINEIWLGIQGESLGSALHFDPEYRFYWTYIPHFIHSPFYVYAYAFGDCLVNSLYALYQDAHPDFAQKYLAMLKAGGTLRHKELLAPFGLDASEPTFWSKGLSVISGLIDELEAMG